MTEATAPPGASFLATRKGQLTLAFLCVVALLDFMGIAIVNVALQSIQRDLHFSQQNLQWVLSGYTVTYGGFLLLGGRLADLLGRRLTLVVGTSGVGPGTFAMLDYEGTVPGTAKPVADVSLPSAKRGEPLRKRWEIKERC